MNREHIANGTSLAVDNYTGETGVQYFQYQSRFGELAGEIIAQKLSLHVKPRDVVLDFGCGAGFVLKTLNCAERLGVEINPIAREAAINNGITCFEALDEIEDETADVAIAHHSLEHVSSPLSVLREMRLKLKRGGLLLVTVPIDDWRCQRNMIPLIRTTIYIRGRHCSLVIS